MITSRYERALVWFRRDLRDYDHAALYHALKAARSVHCAFVFDRDILDALPRPDDRRVEFIHDSVVALAKCLAARGGALIVRHGVARDEIPRLAGAARRRRRLRQSRLRALGHATATPSGWSPAEGGIAFHTSKDQVIFERDEVLSQAGAPFSVFTPYKNAWLKKLTPFHVKAYPVDAYAAALAPSASGTAAAIPSLDAMGFRRTNLAELGVVPGMAGGAALFADFRKRIDDYRETRDFPALKGPIVPFGPLALWHRIDSRTRGVRACALAASRWRRRRHLAFRTHLARLLRARSCGTTRASSRTAFKGEYDRACDSQASAPRTYAAWCDGRTGYPIVDAAMRQLNATGYMHNRLRMVAASFLVKDLLVDWRLGREIFRRHARSTSTWHRTTAAGNRRRPPAVMRSRISGYSIRSRSRQRFDADGKFIRRYVPELARLDARRSMRRGCCRWRVNRRSGVVIGRDYPAPIVDHAAARVAALALYGRLAA